MRKQQPTILTCDHCGREVEGDYGLIGWIQASRTGLELATYGDRDPLEDGLDFCSSQCAALHFIVLADRYEILGHDAMVLLGRSADRRPSPPEGH